MIRTKSNHITLIVITFVILIYLLTPPSGVLPHINVMLNYYYPLLAHGFLSGHLYLPIQPPAALLHLSNPYDPAQNGCCRLMFDASFYKGKYYLYFGPLPAILFFIPIKLLTGHYPTQQMAVWFFVSVGFIFLYCLLANIREKYFQNITDQQFILAGLVLGLANLAMYLLEAPSVYQVAIASAYGLMSAALFFLYKTLNDPKIQHIVLFSLCLSLCVASRPHFALTCLFIMPIICIYLFNRATKSNGITSCIALFLPVVIIGLGLALYNDLRFDSVWEFGRTYQLTGSNRTQEIALIGPNNWGITSYYYFFSPHSIFSTHWLDIPAMTKYYGTLDIIYHHHILSLEYTRSILTIAPVFFVYFCFTVSACLFFQKW